MDQDRYELAHKVMNEEYERFMKKRNTLKSLKEEHEKWNELHSKYLHKLQFHIEFDMDILLRYFFLSSSCTSNHRRILLSYVSELEEKLEKSKKTNKKSTS